MADKGTKRIKIFIASSEELGDVRSEVSVMFEQLNRVFSRRNYSIEAVKWEDLPGYNSGERKQEEYNREIRDCDMCVVVFWQRFGEYTAEEYNVAEGELRSKRRLKAIELFFKRSEVETISEAMKQFRAEQAAKYPIYFANISEFKYRLFLDIEHLLNEHVSVVEDSMIKVDGEVIAPLSQLSFAANNEEFKRLSDEIKELDDDIEFLEDRIAHEPDNKSAKERCNSKKRRRAELRERLAEHEKLLYAAAVRISSLARENLSKDMRHAFELFEQGRAIEADQLLDSIDRQQREVVLPSLKELRESACQYLDGITSRIDIKLTNGNIPINERIESANTLYEEAISLADECSYNQESYTKLLAAFGSFLRKYARYNRAYEIYNLTLTNNIRLFGDNSTEAAISYSDIGVVYWQKGEYDKALEYHTKALEIREKVLGSEHPNTASCYNNIGSVYSDKGEYDKALKFYIYALEISEKVLGIEHPYTATSYNNIGVVYNDKGEYDKALEFYIKALEIREKVLGSENPDTATSYYNIGVVYRDKGEYESAIKYLKQAWYTYKAKLGGKHPYSLDTMKILSKVYCDWMFNNGAD